jgi:hypothetical protein
MLAFLVSVFFSLYIKTKYVLTCKLNLASARAEISPFTFVHEYAKDFLRLESANVVQCLLERVSDHFHILLCASCQDHFFKHIDTAGDLVHPYSLYMDKRQKYYLLFFDFDLVLQRRRLAIRRFLVLPPSLLPMYLPISPMLSISLYSVIVKTLV